MNFEEQRLTFNVTQSLQKHREQRGIQGGIQNKTKHSNYCQCVRQPHKSRWDDELSDWEGVANVKLKEKKQSIWHCALAAEAPTGIWTSNPDTSIHGYWTSKTQYNSGGWWEPVRHYWSESLEICKGELECSLSQWIRNSHLV